MFDTVLIANRGEIAVRAIRTLKRLGIRSVAVYSDADRNAAHVREADAAVALGGEKAADSYLRMDLLLAAAREQGAQAIYPGYGFLSESAEFAEACEAAGIAFVGPTPMQIREFGLKHRSRELAALAGVPMTPGTGLLSSLGEALAQAERIGYPVMLKSTAGGGGIGLSRCDNEAELTAAYDSVQRMGEHFFRDGGAFIERYVDNARHVEVQIFGDGQGRVLALGERDCSVQRRNQKVIEETPAPNLPPATRAALLEAAVRLGESVGYRSAGTVEFIYDPARDSFYFLEVNTRLQVEHPVTEAVTGLDLVECMLRVAAGEPLDLQAMSRAAWRVHRGAAVRRGSAAPVPAFAGRADRGLFSRGPARGWLGGDRHRGAGLLRSHAGQADRAWRHARNGAGPAVRRAGAHAPARHRHQPGLPAPDRGRRALRGGELSTRFLETFEYRPAAIEVLEAGTYTSVQDYPVGPATGISACRRPVRWTITRSGWPTASSATRRTPPASRPRWPALRCAFMATPSSR